MKVKLLTQILSVLTNVEQIVSRIARNLDDVDGSYDEECERVYSSDANDVSVTPTQFFQQYSFDNFGSNSFHCELDFCGQRLHFVQCVDNSIAWKILDLQKIVVVSDSELFIVSDNEEFYVGTSMYDASQKVPVGTTFLISYLDEEEQHTSNVVDSSEEE